LLAEDVSAPLTDKRAVEQRLQLVAWLHEDALRRGRVRAALRALPDFARSLARLTAGRGSPRDLAIIRDGLGGAASLRNELELESERPPLLESLLPLLGGHAALVDRLRAALTESPPIDSSKGATLPRASMQRSMRFATLRRMAAARSPRSRRNIARRPESPRSRSVTMQCSDIMSKSLPSMPIA
jgi:DNA mismatch repair ATPase MutS